MGAEPEIRALRREVKLLREAQQRQLDHIGKLLTILGDQGDAPVGLWLALGRVLERHGIKRSELAVEIEQVMSAMHPDGESIAARLQLLVIAALQEGLAFDPKKPQDL